MTTDFRILFSLSTAHAYYRSGGSDFDFVLPSDVRQRLHDGRLVARVRDGKLYVLYESDGAGNTRIPLDGLTLRWGMKLLNPHFASFTLLDFDLGRTTALYRNATTPGTLDAARESILVGTVFRHTPRDSSRPVTLSLKDAGGAVLRTDTLKTPGDPGPLLYELHGRPPGVYTVEELTPSKSTTATYVSDPELFQTGVFGIVEVKVDPAFAAAPPSFRIAFQARADTLKYYVVASHFTDADLGQLTIEDTGYAADQRPQVHFTRVEADELGAGDIPLNLLGPPDAKVVLFKSLAPVVRSEEPRKKIQLSKNGDVIIPHLPQVGSNKVNGDIIIHLSKP